MSQSRTITAENQWTSDSSGQTDFAGDSVTILFAGTFTGTISVQRSDDASTWNDMAVDADGTKFAMACSAETPACFVVGTKDPAKHLRVGVKTGDFGSASGFSVTIKDRT